MRPYTRESRHFFLVKKRKDYFNKLGASLYSLLFFSLILCLPWRRYNILVHITSNLCLLMHYLFNLNSKQFIGMVNVYSGKTSYFSKADVTSEKQQEQSFIFVKQTPCRLTHWALRRYKKQAPNNSSSKCPSIGAVFPLQLHSWTGCLCQDNRPNHPDPKLSRPGSPEGHFSSAPACGSRCQTGPGWASRPGLGNAL